jgi:iron(II)-dependent oxidoreductase
MHPENLIAELEAARAHTRTVADDLDGAREFGPRLDIVNPPRWEIGHVGWFQEYWCLRRVASGRYATERGAPILPDADALYNSALVPHDARWSLPLPEFPETLRFRDEVLARLTARLRERCDADDAYFAQLATRHEDMHAEAFHYTRQTLGYEAPELEARPQADSAPAHGDAEIAGGTFHLGARDDGEFVFDNEKWQHAVVVRPYRMARTCVSNAQFAEFVDAGGYRRAELWCEPGRRWLQSSGREAPAYWRRQAGGWMQRQFDRRLPLAGDEPVIHVNWFEADAFCRWSNRRLPTEVEWEFAATCGRDGVRKARYPWGDAPWQPELANLDNARPVSVHAHAQGDNAWGVRQLIGNVWEWTASRFLPYPGFLRDPYKEYSEPWFGDRMVLRGGAFGTSPRIARSTYRNFFTPERADVFAGFRTCAPADR